MKIKKKRPRKRFFTLHRYTRKCPVKNESCIPRRLMALIGAIGPDRRSSSASLALYFFCTARARGSFRFGPKVADLFLPPATKAVASRATKEALFSVYIASLYARFFLLSRGFILLRRSSGKNLWFSLLLRGIYMRATSDYSPGGPLMSIAHARPAIGLNRPL